MNRKQVIALTLLAALAALILLGWWYAATQPEAARALVSRIRPAEKGPSQEELVASGTIQATEIAVAAEIGGRVKKLHVREGDWVAQGDVLIELDTALLEAEIAQAKATVRVAQAGLELLKAGLPPTEIAQAAAEVQVKVAERDAALQALQDALAARDNPQELDLQIAVLKAQIRALEHRQQQMAFNKEAATAAKQRAEQVLQDFESHRPAILPPDIAKSLEAQHRQIWLKVGEATNDWWAAWAGLNSAQASLEGARRLLARLEEERQQPLALDAQVAAAEAAARAAEAAVHVAETKVEALRAGPSAQEIATAKSKLAQAEAAVEALEAQLAKMTLVAPRAGLIVGQMIHEGEVAAAGAPLLTIADLDRVTLTVYIPESRIGRVQIGQQAHMVANAYPQRTFAGRVAWIATKAEFTPRYVGSKEERVNTVFAVKIEIPNPEHILKPGMSAEATFLEDSCQEAAP